MSHIEHLRGLIDESSEQFSGIGEHLDAGTEKVAAAARSLSAHEEIKSETRDLCVEIREDIKNLGAKLGHLASLLGEGVVLNTDIANVVKEGLARYETAQGDIPEAIAVLRALLGASQGGGQGTQPSLVEEHLNHALHAAGQVYNGIDNACWRTRRIQNRRKSAIDNLKGQQTKVGDLAQQLHIIDEAVEEVRDAIYDVDDDQTWKVLPAEQALHITDFMSREPGAQGPRKNNDFTLDQLRQARNNL